MDWKCGQMVSAVRVRHKVASVSHLQKVNFLYRKLVSQRPSNGTTAPGAPLKHGYISLPPDTLKSLALPSTRTPSVFSVVSCVRAV